MARKRPHDAGRWVQIAENRRQRRLVPAIAAWELALDFDAEPEPDVEVDPLAVLDLVTAWGEFDVDDVYDPDDLYDPATAA